MTVNNPDKIVFVGEALVGNEAVDQLSKFDRSLRDFSQKKRGIDGILLTKFDTIVSGTLARLTLGRQGWCSTFHDLCHWTTYPLRRLRTNLYGSAAITRQSYCTGFIRMRNQSLCHTDLVPMLVKQTEPEMHCPCHNSM